MIDKFPTLFINKSGFFWSPVVMEFTLMSLDQRVLPSGLIFWHRYRYRRFGHLARRYNIVGFVGIGFGVFLNKKPV
jgi:hypothetical protein